jgi:hypothetical protein
MPSAAHSGVPSCGRRRKPVFTTLTGSVIKRLEATFTAWLDQKVEADGPPATDPQHVLDIDSCGRCGSRRRAHPHEPLYQVPLRLPVDARSALPRPLGGVQGRPRAARSGGACLSRRPERTRADRGAAGPRDHPHPPQALPRPRRVKICRPRSLSEQQVSRVIRFAIRHLGFDYDFRHILDLVRLAVPLPSFARRWRSTLVRPRLRGFQERYLLDPAGAVIHLCGLPRRRSGGGPQ